MSDTNLSVETIPEPGGAVVRLGGEVDLHNSPGLRTTLLELVETHPGRIILDLRNVGYLDSSGVGTIVEFKRKLERAGGRLVLAGLQSRVRGVFEITKLDRFFTIVASLDEARKL